MTNQNQKNNGGFTLGFSLGAATGAAFAYFLQTDEGKAIKEELQEDFAAVKKELAEQGLLPSHTISGMELLSHAITTMAETLVAEEQSETESKTSKKKRKKTSPTLAKNQSKKKQKKFSGV